MKLAVIGAGAWGTGLTIALASRFEEICLWARRADLAQQAQRERRNPEYLTSFSLPDHCLVTSDPQQAVQGADIALLVVPSLHMRSVARAVANAAPPGCTLISASKGLEANSRLRLTEVIREESREKHPIAVLAGPSFAAEVAAQEPCAVLVASDDASIASRLQEMLATRRFRPYASTDVVGVEVGGAVKNVIAIAAGVVAGLGLGNNTQAALVTRGLAEITRLAVAMGGQARTLAGLAGLGDLVLTCSGNLSRNRRVGVALAQGRSLEEAQAAAGGVAEGVTAAFVALELAQEHGVEMPITAEMARCLRGESTPQQAIEALMERSLRRE